MTTAIAIVSGDHVIMGADTQATAGKTNYAVAEKIIRAGEWLIAFSGDGRMAVILRANLEKLASAKDVVQLVSCLKSLVEEDGWVREKETGAPYYGVEFLLARHDKLFEIDVAFAIAEQPGAVIGSGALVGLGALRAILKVAPGLDVRSTVRKVLDIAAELDIYTGAPFQIEST